MSHVYTDAFYDYIEKGSRHSARAVIELMASNIKIGSLLDVGCGRGAWLSEWEASGVTDIIGVDGDYVIRENLHFSPDKFFPADLTQGFDMQRKFDLVQCLEVAEHLPKEASANLIAALTNHSDVVLFSAATPGQGGEHHINEQPLDYWRALFAKHGFVAYDPLRARLADQEHVMPWYKYNAILYVNGAGAARLSPTFAQSRIVDTKKIPRGGSLTWNLRKFVLGLLPQPFVTWLAAKNAERIAARAGQ